MSVSGWEHSPRRLALANPYHEVAAVLGWDRAVDFGLYVWEHKRPPSRRKPGSHDQRGSIYIPHKISDNSGRELVSIMGVKDAVRLVEALGGETLSFPSIEIASVPSRNKAIAEQVRDGWPLSAVAFGFDLSEEMVRRICKAQGVNPGAAKPARRSLWQRRQEGVCEAVLKAASAGQSIEYAAMQWGFMPDVAHAILRGDPPLVKERQRCHQAVQD